jgi:hypothetical protein
MDLKEIEWEDVDWILLAQVSDQWWDPMIGFQKRQEI